MALSGVTADEQIIYLFLLMKRPINFAIAKKTCILTAEME